MMRSDQKTVSKAPAKPASSSQKPNEKSQLHPRNKHQGRYDFTHLSTISPELKKFLIVNPYGKESIDFANPEAVKVFNQTLLKAFYGINYWSIPKNYLCPPIPGRADYLHYLADILAADNQGLIPRGAGIEALDIGVGANCIYPLIGHSEYQWRFLGSDIDIVALKSAQTIVQANKMDKAITFRQQQNPEHIFKNLLVPEECFDITLCNPPFHSSLEEANRGSERKWRALGKADPKRKLPVLNFGGQGAELWCPGGESAYLLNLIKESKGVSKQILWFSTLVSKASNLPTIEKALKNAGVFASRVLSMSQGQKQSRIVAWTYLNDEERQTWREKRWI